jgi:hypothetical protein
MGLFGTRVKGPKAILSSAIASSLGTYFELDENKIESNLLSDTKIVLNDVLLKDYTTQVQAFGDSETGRSSVVHVTGTVKQVVFSWKWSVPSGPSSNSSWVQDATLTIRGLDFKAHFSWWDNNTVDTVKEKLSSKDSDTQKSSTASKKENEENGLQNYIKKQVAMVIDSLKLQIEDYKFTVELESNTSGDDNISIVIGGKAVDIISMGRHKQFDKQGSFTSVERKKKNGENESTSIAAEGSEVEVIHEGASKSSLPLEQLFVMESFSVMVHTTNESKPILDTFSYKAKAIRLSGERFLASMATGLQVQGDPPADGKLNFYAGELQIRAMKELAAFVLAPALEIGIDLGDETDGIEVSLSAYEAEDAMVSFFEFPLNEVSLHLESSKLLISSVVLRYKADGTLAEIAAERLDAYSSSNPNQQDQMCFSTKGIRANLRPSMCLELESVESFRIPDTIELTKPTKNVSFHFNEGMLRMQLSSVHATRLDARDSIKTVTNEENTEGGEVTPNWKAALPFPVNIYVNDMYIMNAHHNNAMTTLRGFELDVAPGIEVALCVQKAQNELFDLDDVAVSASIPVDNEGLIENLHFAAVSMCLTAGRSANEWATRFDSRPKAKSAKVNYKLPFAHIEPLDLQVTFKGIVSTQNSNMIIRPFMGTEATTQKDLVRHYVRHILGKFPRFVTNAEVLGVNVVDSGASTYGSWMLSATHFGPLGGLAAVAGVDGVKGAIAAGKRSRKVETSSSDDKFQPLDVIRGVFQAAKEATEEGSSMRGKDVGRGDVIDWAVGASANTQKYATENKSRLGAAGAGGAAFLAGAFMLGPAAPLALPIAAGIFASAVTGKAIDRSESAVSKEKKKGRIDSNESSKV